MNKTNQKIFDKLENTPKGVKKWDKEQLAFIKSILESAAKKTTEPKNPPILNEEGEIVEKWCSRHEMYHKIELYPMKNGKAESACKVAVVQWREFTKELNVLEKLAEDPKIMEDQEKWFEALKNAAEMKKIRAGKYTMPETKEV